MKEQGRAAKPFIASRLTRLDPRTEKEQGEVARTYIFLLGQNKKMIGQSIYM